MFFSIILLVLTFIAFFAIKAKTFDQLGEWSQLTIVALASLTAAAILTMQFFISIKRTLLAFLDAIEGVPHLLVGTVFLIVLLLVFPLLRLFGRLNMDKMKKYWQEEVVPRQKTFTRSAFDLARTFAWDRTKSLFTRVRNFRTREPEDSAPGDGYGDFR